ncbi:Eukaryotic initiation factor 3gamma subunit family protein [Aphelenchoides avenae]|nr:Eukaryotic initiation factor 3gamma subunit family protein [Aphelenchus avenae]
MSQIEVGRYAVIQKLGGDHMRVTRIAKGQKILVEKLRFHIDGAIGKRFGLFEVNAGQVTEASKLPADPEDVLPVLAEQSLAAKNGTTAKAPEPSDSTEGPSTTSAPGQKITQEEITEMKVSKLVGGSAAFKERTEFAKKKYIEKKTKKHSDRVLILQPSVRLLAQCYYKKDPERMSNLRLDQLGLVLQHAGLRTGSRVVLYEQALGLAVAATLERLAGDGACVYLHRGKVPQSIPCYHAMEFDDKYKDTFLPLRITSLLLESVATDTTGAEGEANDEAAMDAAEDEPVVTEEEVTAVDGGGEWKAKREEKERKALGLLQNNTIDNTGSMDHLVFVVSSVNPISLLEKTFDSLRLSGSVVVYSTVQQHVTTAFEWLRARGVIQLQVSDQFMRGHQVLPGRTHPFMQQSIASGYVLSGVKVKSK